MRRRRASRHRLHVDALRRAPRTLTAIAASTAIALAVASSATADTTTTTTGTTTTGTATGTTTTSYSDSPTQVPLGYKAPANDGLGITPGKIKHVWVIIMENKSYDASFTGLNGNSYLWQTLPSQGALLTNYYATGHSSQDNYLSMFSGQSPISDDQSDCPSYNWMSGHIDTTGSIATNPNYGQFVSAAGDNAPIGDNGCVYPDTSQSTASVKKELGVKSEDVAFELEHPHASAKNAKSAKTASTTATPLNTTETLFNQLDAAGESWRVYAQDVDGDDNGDGVTTTTSHSAGTNYCGAPYSTPGSTPESTQTTAPSTSYANPGSATATDQYVPKHNPLPWFGTVLDSGDCATHLYPVLGADDQLSKDLASASSTPALSVIVPNNCSDAHDAACHGNNLSGGFESGANSQIANAPKNYTGGLYAGDLFLEKVVPEIESSPAFADGGLIDITFDEAYQPYTWQNSFVNSSLIPSTAVGGYLNDEAGETLYGRSVNWEPTGPNDTVVRSSSGQVVTPGPGFNAGYDRPSSSTAVTGATVPCTNGTSTTSSTTTIPGNGWVTTPLTTTTTGTTTSVTGGCLLGGGSTTPGSRTDSITVAAGSSTVSDNSISIKDEGRTVTISSSTDSGDAGTYYVGNVAESYSPNNSTVASESPITGTFQLVNANGQAVTLPDALSNASVTIGAQSAATDPLYDAYDATSGGGDTGSVLISPYIKPGTVSNTYYNHYSLLRTIEDLLQVDKTSSGTAAAGTTQGGLDGEGHLGYADQLGLAPFGTDVFTNSDLANPTTTVTQTITNTKTTVQHVITCVVPKVTGYGLPEARAIVSASQCRVGKVIGKSGPVVNQVPKAGTRVSSGTTVTLTLRKRK